MSAPTGHVHRHPKEGRAEHDRPDDQRRFFDDVAEALARFDEILVVGPSTAKLHLLRHLHRHAPAVESKIVAIETADHPTDGQLVAHARRHFAAVDPATGVRAPG